MYYETSQREAGFEKVYTHTHTHTHTRARKKKVLYI